MKTSKLLGLLLIAIAPAALVADSAMDRKIEDAAKSSYNFRAVLNNQVKVRVQDGVVTLTGTVQDRDQKALAEDTVSELPGVTTVDNQLQVGAGAPERSDNWIALKIRGQLLVHSNVSVANTNVTVKDGVVTLTGTADNVAQKELTESYVKDIEGVKSVQNELVVKEPGANPTDSSFSEKIDDGSITAQVKYALLTHHSTSALKTQIETSSGVVMVKGEAGSAAEKDLVSKLARSVRGVKTVENEMTVRPGS